MIPCRAAHCVEQSRPLAREHGEEIQHALLRLAKRTERGVRCVNVLDVTHGGEPDWIVRAVNVAASDLVHRSTRQTTMEQYWAQYRLDAD